MILLYHRSEKTRMKYLKSSFGPGAELFGNFNDYLRNQAIRFDFRVIRNLSEDLFIKSANILSESRLFSLLSKKN